MLISRFGEFFSLPDRDSSLLEPLNNLIVIKMPQLIPFFFVNQVIFNFSLLLFIIYMFTKYILPRFVRLFLSRTYLSKLSGTSK